MNFEEEEGKDPGAEANHSHNEETVAKAKVVVVGSDRVRVERVVITHEVFVAVLIAEEHFQGVPDGGKVL